MTFLNKIKDFYSKPINKPTDKTIRLWYAKGFVAGIVCLVMLFFPASLYSSFLNDIHFKTFNTVLTVLFVIPYLVYFGIIFIFKKQFITISINITELLTKNIKEENLEEE